MTNPRHQKIISILSTDLEVRSNILMDRLEVSEATLRRDLSELAEKGKIIRTHGGALLRPEAVNEASFNEKELSAPTQKRAIAQYAINMIPAGASVYIDSGTTCLEIARPFLSRGECPIFTNSLPILIEACKYKASVTGIGGTLRELSRALIGSAALNWLENLQFDYSFIGTSAVHGDRGAYTTEAQEALVKQHVIQSSTQAILVFDSSKWTSSAPVRFARWSEFHTCIVDDQLSPKALATLQKQMEIHIAPTNTL